MTITAYLTNSNEDFYKFTCSFASIGVNRSLHVIHDSSSIFVKCDYMFLNDDFVSVELDSFNYNELYTFCNNVGILC